MRRVFKDELYKRMQADPDIYVLLLDLGYGAFDKIREDFPDRCFNLGASEQAGIGIAVGMSYAGKKVLIYSITNFVLYRPFETIRNYLAYEGAKVHLIAAGRDKDYKDDGISHWSSDAKAVLDALNDSSSSKNAIKTYFPKQKEEIPHILDEILTNSGPTFTSLRR